MVFLFFTSVLVLIALMPLVPNSWERFAIHAQAVTA